MTSIDDMADEIMKGLQEYSELADTAMKKQSARLQLLSRTKYLQML